MSFVAQFNTQCDNCEDMIQQGQEVEYNASSRVVHVVCPESLDVDPFPVCQRCFLELPISNICGGCE